MLLRYAIGNLWYLRQRVVKIQQPACSIEIYIIKRSKIDKDISFETGFERGQYFKLTTSTTTCNFGDCNKSDGVRFIESLVFA